MKGNGTTQLVKALRGIGKPGVGITTGTVITTEPLAVRLSGSNLMLDAEDVAVLKHVVCAAGDVLLLLVSADGQAYYALGVM